MNWILDRELNAYERPKNEHSGLWRRRGVPDFFSLLYLALDVDFVLSFGFVVCCVACWQCWVECCDFHVSPFNWFYTWEFIRRYSSSWRVMIRRLWIHAERERQHTRGQRSLPDWPVSEGKPTDLSMVSKHPYHKITARGMVWNHNKGCISLHFVFHANQRVTTIGTIIF